MNELVKNSTRLLSANVIAQTIGLLVYPILTRIYTPGDFGLLNLFITISGIITLLSTAEYQYAIVLTDNEKKASAAMKGATLLLIGSVLTLTLTIPLSSPIARLFNTEELACYWWIMPIMVLISGFWTLLNYFWTRQKGFKNISHYQIIQSGTTSVSKIGIGAAGFTSFGLIVSTIIGPVAGIAATCREWWKPVIEMLKIPRPQVREIAQEYKKLPLYSLPRALTNNLSNSAPALLLAPVFGTFELGFFATSVTLAFRPINMIVASLNQVLFQHVTELVHQKQSIAGFIRHFIGKEMAIVLPVFAGLYFILPWLCGVLLGGEWTICGHYIRWMLPWLVFTCINGIFCFVADTFMEQKVGFFFEIFILVARIAGLLFGIITHNFLYAVMGFSIMSCLAYACQLIWFMRLIRRYENKLIEKE